MNKRKYILAILALVLGLFAFGPLVFGYDETDFSAEGRKYQPLPQGHVPGKDNGEGAGTHNAGEDCGICHTPNGKAGDYVFTAAGTLYEDRAGRKVLEGGEIMLEDIIGNVISMTSNKAGNFWTYSDIASNPCSISSHGGTTETLYTIDPNTNACISNVTTDDSRTWLYKAWVKSGDSVRHMVTIAPVGGMSSARMSCNMHHASMGSRGGLWGASKGTLKSYPDTGMSFSKHILPIFKNKCVPCHIPGDTTTRLTTRAEYEETTPRVDYSSGRDFTSYAGSTVTTSSAVIEKTGIKDYSLSYVSDPDNSPLLKKTKIQPSTVIHPGGGFWAETDADYKAIRQWISEGALDN